VFFVHVGFDVVFGAHFEVARDFEFEAFQGAEKEGGEVAQMGFDILAFDEFTGAAFDADLALELAPFEFGIEFFIHFAPIGDLAGGGFAEDPLDEGQEVDARAAEGGAAVGFGEGLNGAGDAGGAFAGFHAGKTDVFEARGGGLAGEVLAAIGEAAQDGDGVPPRARGLGKPRRAVGGIFLERDLAELGIGEASDGEHVEGFGGGREGEGGGCNGEEGIRRGGGFFFAVFFGGNFAHES